MTIQEFGSIGELLAAMGTIATLAYLGIHIRRSTVATRAASFHAITDTMNQVNLVVAQNPELTRIWLAGAVDRSSLSGVERHQHDLILLSYFHAFETIYY